jgi:hypothetical protein
VPADDGPAGRAAARRPLVIALSRVHANMPAAATAAWVVPVRLL